MKHFVNFIKLVFISFIFVIKNKNIKEEEIRKIVNEILHRFKINVKCIGNFSEEKAVIMANHASYFDVIALYRCFNKKLIWLAKKELFKYPLISRALKGVKTISVNRSNKKDAALSLIKIMKEFKDGLIVIFPYGTRKDNTNFKKGGILIAKKKRLRIIPVKIENSGYIMPPGRMLLRSGEVTVKAFESIDPNMIKREDEIEEAIISKICN